MKTIINAFSIFLKRFIRYFSTSPIIISILFLHSTLLFAQDYQRMQELTKQMDEVLKQLDSCKTNQDCIMQVNIKLQKLTKEFEAAQNTKTPENNTNIPNTNNQPNIPVPPPSGENPNTSPSLNTQGSFPLQFESISKPYIEHINSLNLRHGEPADCDLINKTREKLLKEISKIYDKEGKIKAWNYPMNISYCSEASVTTKEMGEINIPYLMKLKYKIHTEETSSWIVTYDFFLDENNFRIGDTFYFRLWDASSSATVISDYSGWTLDNSVDPPRTIPFDKASSLSEKGDNKVWESGFGGSNISYTNILPAGYDSNGKVTDYMLWLHYEPTRFYPSGMYENYVESIRGTIFEKLSKEDILSALRQGNYHAYYNESDITGTSTVTKEVTITFEPNNCDSTSSAGTGAIVLSGDCIDHGGQVIASKSSFFVNNKQVAYIGDDVMCKKHGMTKIIATKKIDVLSGNKQVARIGDKTECGATIIGGSKNTFAGIK